MYVQIGIGDIEKEEGFIKGLGIKDVSVASAAVENFGAIGYVEAKELVILKEQLGNHGFSLRSLGVHSWSWVDEVVESKVEQKEVDNLCRTIEAMGKAKVETLIMPCSRKPLTSLSSAERREFEKRVIQVYRQLSKIAEQSSVKVASHTSFMPDIMVHDYKNLDRFLEEVGSKANGILLCIGCISLAGYNVEDFIDRYCEKIYAVHIRNVTGNWDKHEETRFDAGQIKIPSVLHKLAKRNYEGCLIPEHFPQIGDDHKMGLSWAVAYIKGICDSFHWAS